MKDKRWDHKYRDRNVHTFRSKAYLSLGLNFQTCWYAVCRYSENFHRLLVYPFN